MRAFVALVFAVALGAILPRVALATPSLDACTGVLHRQAGTTTTIAVDAPGIWCLDQDLVESVDVAVSYFAMITIDSDDVTVDCRGHRIKYTGSASSMHGISSRAGRGNVTVRNCHLHGFSDAISVIGDGFLIEDNSIQASRLDSTTHSTSIRGEGNGIIRRNRIRDAASRGIYTGGSSQVLDNLVDGIARSGSTNQIHAIDVYPADGAEVRGNTVRGIAPGFDGTQDVALMIADTSYRLTVVADNVFVNYGSGNDFGVQCLSADPLTPPNVLMSGNVVSGFTWATHRCILVDNDISP